MCPDESFDQVGVERVGADHRIWFEFFEGLFEGAGAAGEHIEAPLAEISGVGRAVDGLPNSRRVGDGEAVGLAQKLVQARVSPSKDIADFCLVPTGLEGGSEAVGCRIVPISKAS